MRDAVRDALSLLGIVCATDSAAGVTLDLLREQDWAGFILGGDMPNAMEAEVVERIRQAHPMAPVVVVLDALGRGVTLDARTGPPWVEYVREPLKAEALVNLVRDGLRQWQLAAELAHRLAWAAARAHRLTRAEGEIVEGRLSGYDGCEIAARRRVTKDTIKTQVRSILRKSQCHSLDELCDRQRRLLVRTG